jgi:chorismate mutase
VFRTRTKYKKRERQVQCNATVSSKYHNKVFYKGSNNLSLRETKNTPVKQEILRITIFFSLQLSGIYPSKLLKLVTRQENIVAMLE